MGYTKRIMCQHLLRSYTKSVFRRKIAKEYNLLIEMKKVAILN